ncbi:MAG TPA: gliding motility-associated ABC transporter substrate-binding protein GldG [Flavisolibacter sp.]|jgi:gliding-associated putative ABC transporter substrate-binding component GldG|nr:gliding motility-associated ABC transporter substrate-binding protein GldG [Flavisolibacter sp.]
MRKRSNVLWWLLLIGGLVFVNYLASLVHRRIDLTTDKRYTLTRTTRDLVNQLNGNVTIDLFLKGDFPIEFRKLATTTQEFLSVLKESNPSHITYRFIDPQDEVENGKSWGDSLKSLGIEPINLSVQVKAGEENKIVFPYAMISYEGHSSLVNLFPSSKRNISVAELNNAEALMEYQFASTLNREIHPEKPFVAYATGHGEPTDATTYDLQQTINSSYKLFVFDLKAQPAIPDTIKALLIVKPTESFSDAEKLKIDQYVMRGGKVIWFIDNLHAEQDSLRFKSQLIAYERNLNIQDLLFNFGVRINPDLVMDLQCDFLPFAVGGNAGNPQYEFLHWNYYPLFESKGNQAITKNIGLVAGRYVNSIDTVELPGVKKTILLQSSSNSRIISTPALISPNENRNMAEDALFRQHDIPVAVLLEGRFTSFYRARASQAQRDTLRQYGGFRDQSEEGGKMVVVADGDMVLNDVSPKQGPLPMGSNLFTSGTQYEYQFANRDFIINILEYLTSNNNLAQTRNKEIVLRLLDVKKVNEQKVKWQLINIALPVLLIILFGILYQRIRRYRFGS